MNFVFVAKCPKITKHLAVSRITDRTGCRWLSRSSKVDNFWSFEKQYATSC